MGCPEYTFEKGPYTESAEIRSLPFRATGCLDLFVCPPARPFVRPPARLRIASRPGVTFTEKRNGGGGVGGAAASITERMKRASDRARRVNIMCLLSSRWRWAARGRPWALVKHGCFHRRRFAQLGVRHDRDNVSSQRFAAAAVAVAAAAKTDPQLIMANSNDESSNDEIHRIRPKG